MRVTLSGQVTRSLLLVAVCLLSGVLMYVAGKLWRADYSAKSEKPEEWLRAAQLEPGNAACWYRLARFRQWDFEHADPDEAIRHYQRALELDPHSALYWMDLASAYEMVGRPTQAREAFEKAKANYPISAEVAWHYGNFLLRQGEIAAALAEIRRAVAGDPRLALHAVMICWKATGDVARVLNEVIPPSADSYSQALHYFVSQQQSEPALHVWGRLLALGQPLELSQAFPLLELLIRQERIQEATQVWREALRAAHLEETARPENSLVTNGGFERDLEKGGFGWRWQPVNGATLDFDIGEHRSGSRALRLTFDGTANLGFQHLTQYVAVEPRTRYRFATFVRTEGISTDSGIRLRINDARRPASLDVLTANLVGTQPWSLQEAEFTTGPETRLVTIALVRIPSGKFDNKLRGTAWVDDVSLIPMAAVGRGSP